MMSFNQAFFYQIQATILTLPPHIAKYLFRETLGPSLAQTSLKRRRAA